MSAANGWIIVLPSGPDGTPDAPEGRNGTDGAPLWLRVADGRIVARTAHAASEPVPARGERVLLVVPTRYATMRRVRLKAAMPAAQARSVAVRLARDDSIAEAEDLHVVPFLEDEQAEAAGADTAPAPLVATVARADLAHFIAWCRHRGIDPTIVLPAAALLPAPRPEDAGDGTANDELAGEETAGGDGAADGAHGDDATGLVCTVGRVGGAAQVRAPDWLAERDAPGMERFLAGATLVDLDEAAVEQALIAALAAPPVNLRTGDFAPKQGLGFGGASLRRLAFRAAAILLLGLILELGIDLALIAHYRASAARLDARTVAVAQTVLPSVSGAGEAAAAVDGLLAGKGSGVGFTGPVAGLMAAMQPVPGVSLAQLSLEEDGLVHATLASARAESINRVLLAVQAAGYTITATSSTDPGGRVVAEITVKP